MDRIEATDRGEPRELNAAEVGALAHLYRGEVYRSTIWRTRLDNTTNWAVVTMGIALSITFSSKDASPVPLVIVGTLVVIFMIFEARRYRYFNVWRARARWMETHFYAKMLGGEGLRLGDDWQKVLAQDYCEPRHHISFTRAVGRRLRRTYGWILAIQALAYFGKIAIHPAPMTNLAEIWGRTAVGPIPGEIMMLGGVFFYGGCIAIALATFYLDSRKHRERVSMG
jgi:uncharacterized membrane protein